MILAQVWYLGIRLGAYMDACNVTFIAPINWIAEKASGFANASHIDSSLTFVNKDRSLPRELSLISCSTQVGS
jgi:hypothetical protein